MNANNLNYVMESFWHLFSLQEMVAEALVGTSFVFFPHGHILLVAK